MVSIGSHTGRHTFIVVDELIAPVILGMDFFRANKLVNDFSTNPLSVYQHQKEGPLGENNVKKVCTIGKDETDVTNEFNDCAISVFSKEACIESPNCFHSELQKVVQKNKQLFSTTPGSTQEAHHHIVTSERYCQGVFLSIIKRKCRNSFKKCLSWELLKRVKACGWLLLSMYLRSQVGNRCIKVANLKICFLLFSPLFFKIYISK